MNWLNRLADHIAAIGENMTFVCFMAHAGFAFFVMTVAIRLHGNRWEVAAAAVLLAATKEFLFDMHYELNPPQTIAMSSLDFAGYFTGIVLGAI